MIIKLKCSLAFLQGSIEKILEKTKKIADLLAARGGLTEEERQLLVEWGLGD